MEWPAGTIDRSALAVAIYEAFNIEFTAVEMENFLRTHPTARKTRDFVENMLKEDLPTMPDDLDRLLQAVMRLEDGD